LKLVDLIKQCRKIDINEEKLYLKKLEYSGYAKINQAISERLVHKLLFMVKEQFSNQSNDIADVPDEWDAKWVLNLQNKNKQFIDLLGLSVIERLMVHSLNDPHFRHFPKAAPNYILGQFVARSSLKKLPLHIDAGMPQMGPKTSMMQLSFVLEDTSIENGCTHVVPGSHLLGQYSDRNFNSLTPISAKAGDLIIWDARLWHGSGENTTADTRWCIVATFQRWWVKQSFDIPRALPEEFYKELTDNQKAILGFCTIPPLDEMERRTRACNYVDLATSVKGFYQK
jgi:hypothetical protein